jgi:hypothetical protein
MRSEQRDVTRLETPADHVTPYDRFAWSDAVVEHLLASGEHQRELIAYFGANEYAVLAALAREAQRVPISADSPRVFIVPGIMGSQLGRMRHAPLPNDIIWLDPVDISLGQLALLRLPVDGTQPVQAEEHKHVPLQGEPSDPEETRIVSLGVVLFTYLRLKLHLRIAGFSPAFHDYDWRLGIDELGRGLAERISKESSRVMIVAHSMGGLVSRAAMASGGMSHVERVILLGAPNSGSFAPVQALRGVYAVVRKIARLSHHQSAESLAAEVFSTFPSLYHLLPLPNSESDQDLFDAAAWPTNGPVPNVPLLTRAKEVLRNLAPGDARFTNIVGAGQETVTRATRRNGEFVYTITRHGDGTVPVCCAELPGARTYYTTVAHSDLARDALVAHAIAEVLRTGETTKLQEEWSRGGRAEARISDTQLRRTHNEKVDFTQMEPEARQLFLRNLNEPPQLKLSVPATTSAGRAAPKRKPAKRQAAKKKSPTRRPPGRAPAKTRAPRKKAASRTTQPAARRKSKRPARKK